MMAMSRGEAKESYLMNQLELSSFLAACQGNCIAPISVPGHAAGTPLRAFVPSAEPHGMAWPGSGKHVADMNSSRSR